MAPDLQQKIIEEFGSEVTQENKSLKPVLRVDRMGQMIYNVSILKLKVAH